METNKLILITLLVIVGLVVILKLVNFFNSPPVESDASKFVIDDLNSKYPTAQVQILNVTPETNPNGGQYFQVEASVVLGAGTPCPERSNFFYNYPIQNFVAQPTQVITSNCRVCTGSECQIAFPEEAAIAAHTLPGTEDLQSYISTYPNVTYSITQEGDTWITIWDSSNATIDYTVLVAENGSLISIQSTPKTS